MHFHSKICCQYKGNNWTGYMGGTRLTIWMTLHFILVHRHHTHRTSWGADSRWSQ
jgi:hypothetical protein